MNLKQKIMRKDALASLLQSSPDALKEFERVYQQQKEEKEDFFQLNAKDVSKIHEGVIEPSALTERIVSELIHDTSIWAFDGKNVSVNDAIAEKSMDPVTLEEIKMLPPEQRPQLTGTLGKVDMNKKSHVVLLLLWKKYKKAKGKLKQDLYHYFRQGLEILDLDPITWDIIGRNPATMGHWLPQITEAALQGGFFKIPKTTIIKVPLPLLQLTRIEYGELTRATLDIVDEYCRRVFSLDETKEYFIKNGVYSSKYDFQNAHVKGAKEVRELGEYLLFIHHQACMMASPLNNVCIYGPGTTNEWVVREFIPDVEDNPCIYHGLPLHTEYRIFVDFDTKEILGFNPDWAPEVMKKRFGQERDADDPDKVLDYVIYRMHEETLMRRYEENKELVLSHIKDLVQDTEGLYGQWSIDIMQNGNDFYLIDMAPAAESALNHCIPKGKLKKPEEDYWITQDY